MDGAITSGERAAAEVTEALSLTAAGRVEDTRSAPL